MTGRDRTGRRRPRERAQGTEPAFVLVSALVAQDLRSLSEREAEFERLEAQQRRVESQIDRFSARDRLDREELHGRAVR
jgi:predicted  nucleic acid-binding Zn-ribbon protein